MKKMIKISVVTLLGILVLASCDMRELCYDHYNHDYKYQVNIKADYEQEWQYPLSSSNDWKDFWPDTFNIAYTDLIPALPSGLRVMIYDTIKCDRQNIERMGGVVYLTEREKSFLIFNNNTEYIVFNNVENKAEATATTRALSRSTYSANAHSPMKDQNTRSEPDVLYVTYVPSYFPVSVIEPLDLPVMLKPVVYTYYIRFEFEYGAHHIKLARGSMAGMSASVNLMTQEPSEDLATLMFSNAKSRSYGVDASVRSFGILPDTTRLRPQLDGDYACLLNLEVTLPKGYIKEFEYDPNDSILSQLDITDQILSQPKGGVIVIKGLRVEDEEAELTGVGFDPNIAIENWGDFEDVILNF